MNVDDKSRNFRGSGPRHLPDVQGRRQRASRQVFRHAAPQRAAQAGYQKPHPPLWVARSQLETLGRNAARNGTGALGFQFVSADAAHAWVHAYYNAFVKRQQKLADYVTNPNIALVSFFMCAPTDEEARERADGDTFFQFCLKFYSKKQHRRPETPAAGRGQHVGRIQQVEARQPRSARVRPAWRADRLA